MDPAGRRVLLAAAAALALGAAPAHAGVCLTQGPAPRLLTGNAQASQSNDAQNKAIGDWSRQTLAFGPAYQFWNRAARRTVNCTSAKVWFSWVYTCHATAQPCS